MLNSSLVKHPRRVNFAASSSTHPQPDSTTQPETTNHSGSSSSSNHSYSRFRNRSRSVPLLPYHPNHDAASPAANGQIPALSDSSQVIPYQHDSWVVILRNEPSNQVVMYNQSNKTIMVQRMADNEHDGIRTMTRSPNVCLLCRRPFDDNEPTTVTFMDQNYFRLLANALQSPANAVENHNATTQSQSPASSSVSSPSLPPQTIAEPRFDSEEALKSDGTQQNPDSLPPPILLADSSESSSQKSPQPSLSNRSFNQGYYSRFFVELNKLGRGQRGSVFLCRHVLDSIFLGEYAIKKVAVGDNHEWLEKMLSEVHLLEKLRHPNIINYKHAWLENHQLSPFGPPVPCLFILMELANGGNLQEYINLEESDSDLTSTLKTNLTVKQRLLQARSKSKMKIEQDGIAENSSVQRDKAAQGVPDCIDGLMKGGIVVGPGGKKVKYLTEVEVRSIFSDIVSGLAHLHKHGIIHRDLKPPNLLLRYPDSRNKNDIPRILISDFGECEVISSKTVRDRTGATGTVEFIAPELLMVDEHNHYKNDFSFKSDLWSLGLLLYYLCYSSLPYQQIDDVDILKNEIMGFENVQFPDASLSVQSERVPQEFKFLISSLLSRNPKSRPDCEQILERIENWKFERRTSISVATTDQNGTTAQVDASLLPSQPFNDPPKIVRLPTSDTSNQTSSNSSTTQENPKSTSTLRKRGSKLSMSDTTLKATMSTPSQTSPQSFPPSPSKQFLPLPPPETNGISQTMNITKFLSSIILRFFNFSNLQFLLSNLLLFGKVYGGMLYCHTLNFNVPDNKVHIPWKLLALALTTSLIIREIGDRRQQSHPVTTLLLISCLDVFTYFIGLGLLSTTQINFCY
ncbi:kinase-like domain-containing protein [Paraphysoderma sedebokerense]|nr:kinase-like domain-containing protein [Paraphysoderma sedebokerense]